MPGEEEAFVPSGEFRGRTEVEVEVVKFFSINGKKRSRLALEPILLRRLPFPSLKSSLHPLSERSRASNPSVRSRERR